MGSAGAAAGSDPAAADVVRRKFTQRLAGHPVARIARALSEAGMPCPSAADPANSIDDMGLLRHGAMPALFGGI